MHSTRSFTTCKALHFIYLHLLYNFYTAITINTVITKLLRVNTEMYFVNSVQSKILVFDFIFPYKITIANSVG